MTANTNTTVHEVAAGIYRICSPLDVIPGGLGFNSYLITGDEPVLFHTGYRALAAANLAAVETIMPAKNIRWIGGSHFEGDEFGALNDMLAAAPQSTAFGSMLAAKLSLNDFASRPARGFEDGEEFSIGGRRLEWIYTPHVPHGWDCGVLFDHTSQTLFCGDLFTQPGSETPPVTESEILSSSETMRGIMDYYAHGTSTAAILERLASLKPKLLACQHGSAYRGDGASLIRELSAALASRSAAFA